MAYDEALEQRMVDVIGPRKNIESRKMFGGVAFMLNGNMAVGIVEDKLMVRVGPDAYEDALQQQHVKPMDFTGRPMKGYIYVLSAGIKTRAQLSKWIDAGLAFADSLPKKKKKQ